MIIKNQNKNATLVHQGKIANTFFTRLKGLLGASPLTEGEGLLLKGEKSIHTLFMTFPIDVIYLNHALEIIKLTPDMRPWKLGPYVSRSAYILELPVGVINRTNSEIGDHLTIEQ